MNHGLVMRYSTSARADASVRDQSFLGTILISTAKLHPWSSLACPVFTLLTVPALAHDEDGHGRAIYESKVSVSNGGLPANFTDPNLVNGWGALSTRPDLCG